MRAWKTAPLQPLATATYTEVASLTYFLLLQCGAWKQGEALEMFYMLQEYNPEVSAERNATQQQFAISL